MTATFPNGIATFTPKRDNVDVNYAEDINRLQDEIVAIEQALGTLLNTVTDLTTEVVDDESAAATFDQQTTTKFKTLGDRLTWLQNGYNVPAAQVTGSNVMCRSINNVATFQSTMPGLLRMSQPSLTADPYGMYNGSGLTLPKAGFWLISGSVRFDVGSTLVTSNGSQLQQFTEDYLPTDNASWSAKNAGQYQAALEINGNYVQGMDRKPVVADGGYYPNVFLNPIRLGWFSAGTRVYLRASQSSAQAQRVSTYSMSAVWFRIRGDQNTAPTS